MAASSRRTRSIRLDLFHRRRRFRGGIELPPLRSLTAGKPIEDLPSAGRVNLASQAVSPREPRFPLEPEALADMLDHAGLCDSAGRPFGTIFREAATAKIECLIVNALEPEPMLTAGTQVFREQSKAILAAAEWLRSALRPRRFVLAVDAADRSLLRFARAASEQAGIEVVPARSKYPQAHPVLLTRAVTGRTAAPGGSPISVGALVVTPMLLAGLAAAVPKCEPVTHVVITVTGSAVRRPGHYRVPLLTSVRQVMEEVGLRSPVGRVVEGGPMTGRSLSRLDSPVTQRTSAIIAFDRAEVRVPAPGPCVRCGWCQQDCPVGLDPMMLLDIYERGAWGESRNLHVDACLGCGVCSYVCPADLPLRQAATRLQKLGRS